MTTPSDSALTLLELAASNLPDIIGVAALAALTLILVSKLLSEDSPRDRSKKGKK